MPHAVPNDLKPFVDRAMTINVPVDRLEHALDFAENTLVAEAERPDSAEEYLVAVAQRSTDFPEVHAILLTRAAGLRKDPDLSRTRQYLKEVAGFINECGPLAKGVFYEFRGIHGLGSPSEDLAKAMVEFAKITASPDSTPFARRIASEFQQKAHSHQIEHGHPFTAFI